MLAERYFRWSICSPLFVPIIWLVTLYLMQDAGVHQRVGSVTGILFMSMVVGGLPYLAFAGGLVWILRRASLRKLQRFSLYAPLAYAALLFVLVAAASFLDLSKYGVLQPFLPALYYVGWAMGVGYAYVALIHTVYFVLRRAGVFDGSRGAAEEAH